jgi:hypothetical protein
VVVVVVLSVHTHLLPYEGWMQSVLQLQIQGKKVQPQPHMCMADSGKKSTSPDP